MSIKEQHLQEQLELLQQKNDALHESIGYLRSDVKHCFQGASDTLFEVSRLREENQYLRRRNRELEKHGGAL